jgi:hypothetical protein
VPSAIDDVRTEFSVNQSIVMYFTRRERDKNTLNRLSFKCFLVWNKEIMATEINFNNIILVLKASSL